MEHTQAQIGEIKIPKIILDAQKDGRLVIFAGAGVSISSGLPDFHDLTKLVAEEFGATYDPSTCEAPPRFLHGLDFRNKQKNIKEVVSRIIKNKKTKPNLLHKNIVKLFDHPQHIKLITTNFDTLFSDEIENALLEIEKMYYPNITLLTNRKFNGLVYLHGCIEEDYNNIVLTDKDFGTAYFNSTNSVIDNSGSDSISKDNVRGNANNFVNSVFNNDEYVFLLVGYSMRDPFISYFFACNFNEETISNRHALIRWDEDPQTWKSYNVNPIKYDRSDYNGEYKYLYEFFDKWIERNQREKSNIVVKK